MKKHFTFKENANVFYFKDCQVPNHEFTYSHPRGTECRAQQKGLPGHNWEVIKYLAKVKPIFKICGVIFVFIYYLSLGNTYNYSCKLFSLG